MGKNNINTPAVKPAVGVNTQNDAPVTTENTTVNSGESTTATTGNQVGNTVVNSGESTTVTTGNPVEKSVVIKDELLNTGDSASKIETHEAKIIPSGRFIAENGDEYEITVDKFLFKQKKYTKEEALANPDVLEHLASTNSFILKKV